MQNREEDQVGGSLNLRCPWDITAGTAGIFVMMIWGRGDRCLNE